MSLTSPLGLTRHLRRPDLRLDPAPWLNVLALGGMLSLLGTRFINSTGMVVDVGGGGSLLLPVAAGSSGTDLPGRLTDDTLTIVAQHATDPATKKDTLTYRFFFRDAIYHSLDDLAPNFHARPPAAGRREAPVLLLKSDRALDLQTLGQVLQLAHAAGFGEVLIAAGGSAAGNKSPRP